MKDCGLKAFVSYSHKDEVLRSALDAHLAGLVSEGIITVWNDRAIEGGEEWEKQIEDQLEDADIVLLLISSDFLASPYCYGNEMQRALKRHEKGHARVVPVILRPVDWHHSPFSKLQALPKDGKPVTTWPNQDEALSDVALGLRRAAASILNSRDMSTGAHAQSHSDASDPESGLGIKATKEKQEAITVTVRLMSVGRAYQCEIPLDARVDHIIIELVQKLNAPRIAVDGQPVAWDLFSKSLKRSLDSRKTLRENNIKDGDTLHFYREVTAG